MGIVFDYREHAPPKGEMPDSLLTTLWLAGWCKFCAQVLEKVLLTNLSLFSGD